MMVLASEIAEMVQIKNDIKNKVKNNMRIFDASENMVPSLILARTGKATITVLPVEFPRALHT